MEAQHLAAAASLGERGMILPGGQHHHVDRRIRRRQQAHGHQVLLQARRFAGAGGGHARRVLQVHPADAGKADFAVLDVALPQAGLLHAHQQAARRFEPGAFDQGRREQCGGIDPDQADFVLLQRREPGLELLRVGERRVQDFLVAPLALLVTERQAEGEGGVAVAVRELALQHLPPVLAAEVGNGVLVVILLDHVDHQIVEVVRAREIGGEGGDALVVALEGGIDD